MEAKAKISFDVCHYSLIFFVCASAFVGCEQALNRLVGRFDRGCWRCGRARRAGRCWTRLRGSRLDPPGRRSSKVLRAGICNTDLEILRGYMGFQGILGHEFVGVVSKRTCSVSGGSGNRLGYRKHGSSYRGGAPLPLSSFHESVT